MFINTADVIGCSRQDAKAHTFKPLYGGMMGKKKRKRILSKVFRGRSMKTLQSGIRSLEDTAI